MVKTIPLTCPNCKANLNVDENLTQCFCQYCGTKILIDKNETVFVYRDEAKIQELEMKKQAKKEAKEKTKKKIIVLLSLLGIEIVLIVICGIINIDATFLAMLMACALFFLYSF